jgi:hypothetical protein
MPSDLRSTGRIVAAVAFTAVVGVIVWAVVNQRAGQGTPASPVQGVPGAGGAGTGAAPAVQPPPTVAPPATTSPAGTGGGALLAGSGVGTWTRADPRTGVIESRLDYTKLTPLPGGRYELQQPGAWLFTDGIARAHVSAPTATVVWPTREEPPEAGDLLGGVVVRVFDASTPEGETPPLDRALYTLAIDSIHFEGAMSQLESTDPLTVRGAGVSVEGSGLTLRFSPVGKRLQYARTIGKRATIDPDALSKGVESVRGGRDATNKSTAGSPKKPGAPKPTAALEPCEIAMSGSLRVKQGDRSMHAEALTLWAMLQGGQLPDGAVASFDPVPGAGAGAPGDKPAAQPSSAKPTPQKPIEVVWSGPLEFRSLTERPAKLGKDLLRLALSAPTQGGVKLADAELGATLEAREVEYGATTRTLAVTGPDVKLRAKQPGAPTAESYELDASRLDLDLTSGVGAMPGAGRLASVLATSQTAPAAGGTASTSAGTSVVWQGRADFVLDTTSGPAGAGGVFLPSRFTLSDRVTAKTPEGEASADLVDARFRRLPATNANTKPTAIPAEIVLTDAASAKTDSGTVRADRLTLSFAEAPDEKGRAVPRAASGRGRAVAEQRTKDGVEKIEAEVIDAAITRDAATGKVGVSSLAAERGVIYTGRDGAKATADRLNADVQTRIVGLVGTPAVVGRFERVPPGTPGTPGTPGAAAADAEQVKSQRIAGERINLDGIKKSVTVPGPGEGRYESASAPGGGEKMVISWMREMTYDDTRGEAVLLGDVVAKAARGDTDRYKAEGDRAVVKLGTPVAAAKPDGSEGKGSQRPLESVTIERLASTAAAPDAKPTPITITARKYIAGQPIAEIDADTAKLEGLVHLKGPSITVLPQRRTVTVPGPGVILLVDRRSLADAKPEASILTPAGAEGGSRTKIEWADRLETLEPSGTLRINGGVRVRHLPNGAVEAIQMEATALSLDLEWPAPTDANQEPRLKRVLADGGVSVIQQRLRFTGEALSYDAGSNELIVSGVPGRPVTINDAETGVTTTADAVALDPQKGTWRATNAGTITVPR